MAEGEVVVLGQEARGSGGARVGERPVGNVEQLAPALVAEAAQPRAQALDHLAQPGEPAPGAQVAHRRRPEGGEVAQDDRVGVRLAVEALAQPPLGERPRRLAAPAPQPARRDLHQRQVEGDRRADRRRVGLGPARPQRRASSARVRGALGQQRGPAATTSSTGTPASASRNGLRKIRASSGPRERLDGEVVARGDEVDRRPHQPGRGRARRSAISSLSSSARKPSIRDHSAR